MAQITIRLSKRRRELLLRYGYPFEEIERQLREHADNDGEVDVTDDNYWWEQVAGQLSISVNEELAPADHALCDEVNELAELIELELES